MKQIRCIMALLVLMLFSSGVLVPAASAEQKILPFKPGIVAMLPDLVVQDIRLDSKCHVVVSVKNNGPGTLQDKVWSQHSPKSAGVYLRINGKPWGGATIWKFDPSKKLQKPGGTATYTSNLKVSGSAVIEAEVDLWNEVTERNEANNTRKEKLSCSPVATVPGPRPIKLMPDLEVEEIWLDDGCRVAATIRNNGPGALSDDVYYVHTPESAGIYFWKDGKRWGGATIWKLDPSKKLQKPGGTVTYTSNLTVSGTSNIMAQVDLHNKVAESNENNNRRTKQVMCREGIGIAPVGGISGTVVKRGDLKVSIEKCPQAVKPGQELGSGFVVRVHSSFQQPVNGVVIDLVLKKNPLYAVPAPNAVYSSSYADGVLLKGGRENISFSGPGWKTVKLNGTNTIPADTPPGLYYLGAVVDAGNRHAESNEKNNVAFCKVRVKDPDAGPAVLQEDCVSFNPKSVRVRRINGSWKIVDGNHWLFDFGSKRDEAMKAYRIIRHYQMNRSCFVGRPDPSFTYMLVGSNAPSGSFPGEDCVSFNPQTIEVKRINNRWKIVDGNHWVFDFGNRKAEAVKAYNVIRKYGFRYSCYVGRPDPSFSYLRR
ncbi:MAG: CARDB domain-containing protein [Prosthecochloris sp.]|nr:CARDB domain-containing protein [Prosthecochloris sp.]